jgi:LemA protein
MLASTRPRSRIFVRALALAIVSSALAGCGINTIPTLQERAKAAWSEVLNQYQRRADLIPNLVETVKGYAKHESELFTAIADARTKYFQPGATQSDKLKSANQIEGLLSRLLVLQEQYPQLKANESFLKLQDTLEGTENRVSVERTRYNDSVRTLNSYVNGFPGRIFAGFAGVKAADYFEAAPTAKEAPKVNFGTK